MLNNDVVLYALLGSAMFLAAYAGLARGYRSGRMSVGWALITLDTGLVLALLPSVLHRIFGIPVNSAVFQWYFIGSLFIVGSAAWWRAAIVAVVQWRGRHAAAPVDHEGLLREFTGLVGEIAADDSRDISEAVAWAHAHDLGNEEDGTT
jgi:hypothetical protein